MNAGRASHRLLGLVLVVAWSQGMVAAAAPDRQARALAEIEAREYELSWQAETPLAGRRGAWQAPNRAHNLRTYFTPEGVRVVPRLEQEQAEQPSWEWGLALVRYGRAGEGAARVGLGESRLTPQGNRLDRDWGTSGVTEWYVNDSRGLKHGFTLAEGPGGAGEVQLDLALSGALHPTISAGGQAVDFSVPGGITVLRYAELSVLDARGRELPARMEGFAEGQVRGIRIVFEDRDAVYPVTVDPLVTSTFWQNEGQQANARYGFSVATAGDVNGDGYSDILVGAEVRQRPGRRGPRLPLPGRLDGMSQGLPNWIAESDQAGALFGGCVATGGRRQRRRLRRRHRRRAHATTTARPTRGAPSSTSARPSAWPSRPSRLDRREQPGQRAVRHLRARPRGTSTATAISDVIVGAPATTTGQIDEGRAFVYHGSASGLAATPAWTAESDQAGALLRRLGRDRGRRQRRRLRRRHRRRAHATTTARPTRAAPSSTTARPPACVRRPRLDRRERPGQRLLRRARWRRRATSTATATRTSSSAPTLRQRPDRRGARLRLPRLGRGLGHARAWTAESDQAGAALRHLRRDRGRRQRRRLRRRHRRRLLLRQRRRPTRARAFVYHGSRRGPRDRLRPGPPRATRRTRSFGCVRGHGRGRQRRRLLRRHRRRARLRQRRDRRGARLRLPRLGVGPRDEPRLDRRERPGQGAQLRHLGGARPATSTATATPTSSSARPLRQRPDRRGPRLRLPRLAPPASPRAPAWTAESDQARCAASATRWRRRATSTATATPTSSSGHYSTTTARRGEGRAFVYHGSASGLADGPGLDRRERPDRAPVRLLRWRRRGTSTATATPTSSSGRPRYDNGADLRRAAPSSTSAPPPGLRPLPPGPRRGDSGRRPVRRLRGDRGRRQRRRLRRRHRRRPGHATAGPTAGGPSSTSARPPVSPRRPPGPPRATRPARRFGCSVATAGDVNGDGFADVIVGARDYDNGEATEGGPSSTSARPPGLRRPPGLDRRERPGGATSASPSRRAGDVNGDGFADVIVGAPTTTAAAAPTSTTARRPASAARPPGPGASGDRQRDPRLFGFSVAGAGDVNGDGFSDLIVGAPSSTAGHAAGGHGLPVPRQRRARQEPPGPAGALGRHGADRARGTVGLRERSASRPRAGAPRGARACTWSGSCSRSRSSSTARAWSARHRSTPGIRAAAGAVWSTSISSSRCSRPTWPGAGACGWRATRRSSPRPPGSRLTGTTPGRSPSAPPTASTPTGTATAPTAIRAAPTGRSSTATTPTPPATPAWPRCATAWTTTATSPWTTCLSRARPRCTPRS